MNAVQFKFDHSQENVFEACGINEEQVEKLYDRVNEIGNSCGSMSEAIEKMAKKLTPLELSFIMNHNNSQQGRERSSIQKFMESMMLDISSEKQENKE